MSILLSIFGFLYGVVAGLHALLYGNWMGLPLIFLGLVVIYLYGSFTSLCSRALIAPK